ncbi:hypothetical protein GCM10010492_66320 [Saccharothrix mutabilis subsp. mutabilis]|uniref:Uncharacterized protein n=1 Tax=Saccharothrix mutabilis subsp. mutabilis TaxID=66855 RepID=A0ABP3EC09_9PSEU
MHPPTTPRLTEAGGRRALTAAAHKSEELHEMFDELAGMAARWEERRQQES